MLKYIADKPYTFDHRMAMCEAVQEGTELEDSIELLLKAARTLHAFEDFYCEMVLLIAEQLCVEYVKDCLWARQCDWEEYNWCDPEVYSHFTGGARKLSEEEFESNKKKI